MSFLQEHRNLTVTAAFVIASLIAWSLTLQSEDPFLNGTMAQVFAALAVFLVVNQYIMWLRVVPKIRRLRDQDMSYKAALAYAGAAPLIGGSGTYFTGIDWPLWTCIALGLVGSVGPLSVLDMTDRLK